MKEIELRARDGTLRGIALVDDENFAWATLYRWYLGSSGYAQRTVQDCGDRETILMHRKIAGLARGNKLEVDHIDGNKLDNRVANLRIVTRAQNCQNIERAHGRRGAHLDPQTGVWVARVYSGGRNYYLGRYPTADAAARVAMEARRTLLPFAVPERSIAS